MGLALWAARGAIGFATGAVLVACQSTVGTKPDPSAMPKSPSDLPAAPADLTLSGPVSGHVTEVRIFRCGSGSESGEPHFYADAFFQIGGQWYFLELSGETRIPRTTGTKGYSGPGRYEGNVYLRAMDLYPGGLVTKSAWSNPPDLLPTVTVGQPATPVAVGAVARSITPPRSLSDTLVLWPTPPDSTGPRPFPTPEPDQVIRLTGSWSCH
jgi:hypothetical protein